MKSLFIVALCILVVAVCQNSTDVDGIYTDSVKTNRATMFMNYASAFDSYYLSEGGVSGDVTNNVMLPSWLPTDRSIRMYIDGGYGYVFMPSTSGVLSEIMRATEYSALVGFTDSSSLITMNGKIPKPSFIPVGYIVYVR